MQREPPHVPVPTFSLVVPTSERIDGPPVEFRQRESDVMDAQGLDYEMAYVNDGSADATTQALRGIQTPDARVVVVRRSCNFGKKIVVTVGLDHTRGGPLVPTRSLSKDAELPLLARRTSG